MVILSLSIIICTHTLFIYRAQAIYNKGPFDSIRLWLMRAMDIPVREKKVPKKREWWK